MPAACLLLQLLALHGMSSSKFNRTDILQALKGKHIANPTCIIQPHSSSTDEAQPDAASSKASHTGVLPFSEADLGSLGWAVDTGCALEQLQLGMPAGFEAAAASVPKPVTAQTPAAAAAATTAAAASMPATMLAAATDLDQPSAALHVAVAADTALPAHTLTAAACQQQQQQQAALANHVLQHAAPTLASSAPAPTAAAMAPPPAAVAQTLMRTLGGLQVQHRQTMQTQQPGIDNSADLAAAAAAAEEEEDPMQVLLRRAGLQDGCRLPKHVHAPWMLQQLRLFVAGGAVASQEKLPPPPSAAAAGGVVPGVGGGSLLGRGIGFVLLEDMQVAGLKGTALTLPAGVYEVSGIIASSLRVKQSMHVVPCRAQAVSSMIRLHPIPPAWLCF
jgi:hypothetical protein